MSNTPEDLAVLVPVKDLTRAKTRLAGLLTPEERRGLAHTMLRGVLTGIAAVESTLDSPFRRTVVTNYPPAIEMAGELGFSLIREERQISESHSVDAASALLEKEGVRGVLRIPLDLPLFTTAALETVLTAIFARNNPQSDPPLRGNGRTVLVPSRDRLGTNALFRSPPTMFPSRFGHNSLELHTREARQRNGEVILLEVEALALDIDDPADVAELLRRGTRCPALDFLESIGISSRIGEGVAP